jgi:uncharacterized protein YjiS (DUF1127 family)
MLLHDLGKRFVERLRINRDIHRLRRLDDYLLADMGVERERIAERVLNG